MGNNSPTYEILGKLYNRITRILDHFQDPELVKWKLKVGVDEAKRIGKEATGIGSRVDELIKRDFETKKYKFKPSDPIEVRNCMEAWELFKIEHPEVKIWAVDILVRSELISCAGTLDVEAEDEILDIKCAAKISWKYWIQVAMYNFMHPNKKRFLSILRLHKFLAMYEYQRIPYDTKLVRVFIGLLRAYKMANIGGEDGVDTADTKVGEESEVGSAEVLNDRPGRNW